MNSQLYSYLNLKTDSAAENKKIERTFFTGSDIVTYITTFNTLKWALFLRMLRYKALSEFQKGIIAGHVNGGWGGHRIAQKYHWNVSTVQSLVTKFKKMDT